MSVDEYVCALSGKTPTNEQTHHPFDSTDELDDLPIGWSKVSIQTRVVNPDYVNIQQIKETILQGFLADVPDDKKKEAMAVFQYQVAAQFAALESQTAPFLIDERICYVSDPSSSTETQEAWNSFLERLDLVDDPE